ncbi:MAG: pyridoxamine 5'-phosphate oxidase family protein [Peptococcaceae bacterium]|nr:pyridoxamine 5'-phosphate oxidase family protein [Peptococcaceae bacterium]
MPKHSLSEDESRSLLAAAVWGRLATISPEGPYITPMHFVLDNDTIYFHSSPKGLKLNCIRADGRACFEVSELVAMEEDPDPCKYVTRYRSVQVFGRARVVDDAGEKVHALNLLSRKYFGPGDFPPVTPQKASSVAVIALSIDRLSGRANLKRER